MYVWSWPRAWVLFLGVWSFMAATFFTWHTKYAWFPLPAFAVFAAASLVSLPLAPRTRLPFQQEIQRNAPVLLLSAMTAIAGVALAVFAGRMHGA